MRTSAGVRSRWAPISSEPMAIGPIFTRTSFKTLLPTASIIRRTCRFRPSVSVISRNVLESESRILDTTAGLVGPSSRTTPCRSFASAASSNFEAHLTRYVFST